jgi:hypothetical protein
VLLADLLFLDDSQFQFNPDYKVRPRSFPRLEMPTDCAHARAP